MITARELSYIETHAYIPEHIPGYVRSVSRAEPYLLKNFLCYKKDRTLIFIGYPLGEPFEEKKARKCLDKAVREFNPHEITVIGTSVANLQDHTCLTKASDSYYRFDIGGIEIAQKVKNMISRASRDLVIELDRQYGKEQANLVSQYLGTRNISSETGYIFQRLQEYLSTSETALVMNARDREGELVAFDIAEFGSKDYAFYMFNFASRDHYVPGASDLLLKEMILLAREKGKRFMNLGLGINKGISFFKTKWGGTPFLDYRFCQYEISRKAAIETLLGKL